MAFDEAGIEETRTVLKKAHDDEQREEGRELLRQAPEKTSGQPDSAEGLQASADSPV